MIGWALIAFTTCAPSIRILTYGDSKTFRATSTYGTGVNHDQFQVRIEQSAPCLISFNIGTSTGQLGTLARGNNTVAQMKALVDADLAFMTGVTPTHILSNLGTVDLITMPAEADFKSDYGYILDAFHAKWPSAAIYVAKPWHASFNANANTVSGWIDTVLSTRAWVTPGHDERVWAKGADNGATMLHDGVHYSLAGVAECARQWLSITGL